MTSSSVELVCSQRVVRSWASSERDFNLDDLEEESHVWRAAVDLEFEATDRLEQRLSIDERLRAGRFRYQKDRIRFVATRSMLRQVIARYLAVRDDEVAFEYGPYGKPFLHRRFNCPRLAFNLSHSGSMALLAVATDGKIGIDLELVRENINVEEVAKQYFSKWEVMELGSLAPETRIAGFFNCWTRKEAYVKASGLGLQTPLDRFQVSLSPERPARFIRGVGRDWRLASFVPAIGYVAAIASRGGPMSFAWQNWRFPSAGAPSHSG